MYKFYSSIVSPFSILKKVKLNFFIWFMFTILAGQLGIIANIIIRYFTQSTSVTESLYLDSLSGSFYTFSIAIAASALSPIFENFVNNKPKFSSLKIVTIVLTIFFLIISSIIYAAFQMKYLAATKPIPSTFDFPQFAAYIVSIFIGLYAYCLMKIDTPEFDHLDDEESFNEKDDAEVKNILSESAHVNDDGSGVKI